MSRRTNNNKPQIYTKQRICAMLSKVISVSEKLSEYRIGCSLKGVIGYCIDMGLGDSGIVSLWVGNVVVSRKKSRYRALSDGR